jgi:hypothetical protein
MKAQLTGSYRRTYEAIFRHPTAHNLQWRNVRAMLSAIAEVIEEPNGNLKVTHDGHTLLLHPSRHKDVADVGDLVEIRRFLERCGGSAPPAPVAGAHLLVVIDHRQARVYQTELHGAVPQRIVPYDPHGFGRYLHNVQDDSNGQRKPELKSYYEAVAQTLRSAEKILVFGSGTGASSAMEQLLIELKRHHHALADRIVGMVVLDEQHLTDDQLLARAREVYATPVSQTATPLAAALGA